MTTPLSFKSMPGLKEDDLEVEVDRHGEIIKAEKYDFEKKAWVEEDPNDIAEFMLYRINRKFLSLDTDWNYQEYCEQREIAEG